MNKKLKTILIIIFTTVFLIFLSRVFKPKTNYVKSVNKKVNVEILNLNKADNDFQIISYANIKNKKNTTLINEINSKVIEINPNFEIGASFKMGEVLIKLDSKDTELQLLKAKIELTNAEKNYKLEKAESKIAKLDFESNQIKASDLALRKPQLKQAGLALEMSKLNVEKLKNDLEATEVKAPYDCTIRSKNVELGEYLVIGKQIANIYSNKSLILDINLAESNLKYLDLENILNNKLSFFYADNQLYNTNILRGQKEVNPNTGYVLFQTEIPGNLTGVYSGGSLEVLLNSRKFRNSYKLPKSSLIKESSKIVLIDSENKLYSMKINIIYQDDKFFITDHLFLDTDKVLKYVPNNFYEKMEAIINE